MSPEISQLNCYYYLQVFKLKMVDIKWYVMAGYRKLMNNVILQIRAVNLNSLGGPLLRGDCPRRDIPTSTSNLENIQSVQEVLYAT